MIIFFAFVAYLTVGMIFSIYFLTVRVSKVDAAASGASWIFKLLILPGCILLWPVLIRKKVTT